jgi:carotenoid cleavage dioxygenase
MLADTMTRWASGLLAKTAPHSNDNPFLAGPFAPVGEERTETDLPVTGRIPVELDGLFARNGPNPMAVPNPGVHHWFVGDGMVHGLRLHEGRALWYRNRWVASDRVNGALRRPPLPGPRHGVSDTANTNVIAHAGRMWAIV